MQIPGDEELGILSVFSSKSREFEFREQGITMLVFAVTLAIHDEAPAAPKRLSELGNHDGDDMFGLQIFRLALMRLASICRFVVINPSLQRIQRSIPVMTRTSMASKTLKPREQ
jgi:hypothetical protein